VRRVRRYTSLAQEDVPSTYGCSRGTRSSFPLPARPERRRARRHSPAVVAPHERWAKLAKRTLDGRRSPNRPAPRRTAPRHPRPDRPDRGLAVPPHRPDPRPVRRLSIGVPPGKQAVHDFCAANDYGTDLLAVDGFGLWSPGIATLRAISSIGAPASDSSETKLCRSSHRVQSAPLRPAAVRTARNERRTFPAPKPSGETEDKAFVRCGGRGLTASLEGVGNQTRFPEGETLRGGRSRWQ
jgi:hypothetical protein